jgi:acetyl-CoA carboxylase carboxyltransferase component
MSQYLKTLREMRERAMQGGGAERIAQQHGKGKMTARERLALLLDEETFQELGALATHNITDFGMEKQCFPGDGVVTGFGKINGRRVAVFAQDFTVVGGSFSEVQSHKICRIQDVAMESGIPIIGLNDSGGARIQEGFRSLAAYGEVFVRNVLSSGVVPQISVMLGPCAGGSVYSPALTDFVIMARGISYMFITGPDVIKAVTGEEVNFTDLGGTLVHNSKSGVAQFLAESDHQAIDLVKLLLSYLPQNNAEDPPQVARFDSPDRMEESLNSVVPEDENEPYDMHEVIDAVVDHGSFLEVHTYYARNAVVGFARLDGYSVGIVANQPAHLAGVLDIDSSDKIARFVRMCDAFNIPLITFVDTPGYMSSRQMRCDVAFAWPTAQIAVMGAEGAVRLLRKRELASSANPAALERQFVEEYRTKFFNPYTAANVGQIDEVIEPKETRPRLIRALEVLRTKVKQNPPKKHGLMPV